MARDDAQFRVRLPDKLRAEIIEQAEKNGRSINAEIVARLENSLGWDRFDPEDMNAAINDLQEALRDTRHEISELWRAMKLSPSS